MEHPSVAERPYRFPENTVWAEPRPKRGLWIATLAMCVFFLAHGDALHKSATPLSWDWHTWLARASQAQLQNWEYVRWQLLWRYDDALSAVPHSLASPTWAMAWDLGLIGAYAYVLSWCAVFAFARHLHRLLRFLFFSSEASCLPWPHWHWHLPLAAAAAVIPVRSAAPAVTAACPPLRWCSHP